MSAENSAEWVAINQIVNALEKHAGAAFLDRDMLASGVSSAFLRYNLFESRTNRNRLDGRIQAQLMDSEVLFTAVEILRRDYHELSVVVDDPSTWDHAKEKLALADFEVERREFRMAIALLQRQCEYHSKYAAGLKQRLDLTTPKTSEGNVRARDLLFFEIFKVCCDAVRQDFRFVRMSNEYRIGSTALGYSLQTAIHEAWKTFSGEELSPERISKIIRKQNGKPGVRRKKDTFDTRGGAE